MIINNFNFRQFHTAAFGAGAALSVSTGRALCSYLQELDWASLQAFCNTTDESIAFITIFNHAYLVATPSHYYVHGVDYASIEEQIAESELIAASGMFLEESGYSLETAWPAEGFRKLGLITGEAQWSGIFRSL